MNPLFIMKPFVLLLLLFFVFILLFDFKLRDDSVEDVRNVSKAFKNSCEILQKLITQQSTPHSGIDETPLNSEIFPLSQMFVECKWRIKLSRNSRHFLLEINSFNISLHKHLPIHESSSQSTSANISSASTGEDMENDVKMDSNLNSQFVDEYLCHRPHNTTSDEFCSLGFIEIELRKGSSLKVCFCPERHSFNLTIPATTSRVWIKVMLNLTDNILPTISANYYVQEDKEENLATLGFIYFLGVFVSIVYPLVYYSIQESKREIKFQHLNAGEEKLNKLMKKMEIMELLRNKFPHMLLDQPQLMCQLRNILEQSSNDQQNLLKINSGQTEDRDVLPEERFQTRSNSEKKLKQHQVRALSEGEYFNGLGQSNPSFHSNSDIRKASFQEVDAASCTTPKKTKKRKRISKVWRFLPRDTIKCHDISCEEDSSDARQTNYDQPQLEAVNIENVDGKCSIERSSTVHHSESDDDDDRHQLVKLCKPTPASPRKDLFSQISDELKAPSSDSMFVVSSLDANTFSNSILKQNCRVDQTYVVKNDPVYVSQLSAELYCLQPNSSNTSSEKNYSTFNPSETLEYLRAQDKLSRIISDFSSESADVSSLEGQQMIVLSNSITASTTKGQMKSGQEKIKYSKMEDITFLPTRHSTPKQFLTFNPLPNTERAKVTWGDQIVLPKLEKTAECGKFMMIGKSNQDANEIEFLRKSQMNYGESKV